MKKKTLIIICFMIASSFTDVITVPEGKTLDLMGQTVGPGTYIITADGLMRIGTTGTSKSTFSSSIAEQHYPSSTAKHLYPSDSILDIEGNIYRTIRIGNQIWTVENWRSTKYADGTPIPHVRSGGQWEGLTTPAYCWYANSTDLVEQKKWGALYNWYAVSTGKIAPKGWRVPTDADWTKLGIGDGVIKHNIGIVL